MKFLLGMVVAIGTAAGDMAGAGATIIGIIIGGMAITTQTVIGYWTLILTSGYGPAN